MQQKRNHLAVLPKPSKHLEARAGAIFARTRKKCHAQESRESSSFFAGPPPFGAEPRLPNMNAWSAKKQTGSNLRPLLAGTRNRRYSLKFTGETAPEGGEVHR